MLLSFQNFRGTSGHFRNKSGLDLKDAHEVVVVPAERMAYRLSSPPGIEQTEDQLGDKIDILGTVLL